MKIIETTEELKNFCQTLNRQNFITIDLEFHREKTYYAKLGLIQIACSDDEAVIDPLSQKINLEPFFAILKAPHITKVFHSCRQDIEILYFLAGFVPAPLFDTQIAAQVCGLGTSISYENLVRHFLNIKLDKSCRLTDWCRRPLDKKQLEYALSDVTWLAKIYPLIKNFLRQSGREHWIDEEMQSLLSPENYITNPADAWKKIRHRSHNAKTLTLLRDLAQWRELLAQKKNLPRQNIIRDDCLVNIAVLQPRNIEELAQIRSMRQDIAKGSLGREIIAVVTKAGEYTPADYVKLPEEKNNDNEDLCELLKLLLNIKSRQENVTARLIASEDDLKDFADGRETNLPFLSGWRFDIFGKDAVCLRSGTLGIRYDTQSKSIGFSHLPPTH